MRERLQFQARRSEAPAAPVPPATEGPDEIDELFAAAD